MTSNPTPSAESVVAMERRIKRESQTDAWRRAHELHRRNGHPEGYDGPCWGPTEAEWEEARTDV